MPRRSLILVDGLLRGGGAEHLPPDVAGQHVDDHEHDGGEQPQRDDKGAPTADRVPAWSVGRPYREAFTDQTSTGAFSRKNMTEKPGNSRCPSLFFEAIPGNLRRGVPAQQSSV